MDFISLMRFRKVRVEGMYHLVLMGTHCRMMFPLSSVTERLMANTSEGSMLYTPKAYLASDGTCDTMSLSLSLPTLRSVVPYCFLGQKGQIAKPESLLGKISFQRSIVVAYELVEFLVVFRLNVYHLSLFGGEGEGFEFQFHGCR